ncbi:MAG TPA: hypothetical protein V6C72_11600, partial [Chroococcales cyanobacterium]
MRTRIKHWQLETNPESALKNSQTPGIGRLAAIENYLLINNLGKNLESAMVADGHLQQVARFEQTLYPNQDDEQQFDIDMHSLLRWRQWLLAINHYGLIRFLDWEDFTCNPDNLSAPDSEAKATCRHSMQWPGDVERFEVFDDCLISSSPQGYSVPDQAQNGLLISAPLHELSRTEFISDRQAPVLPYNKHLEDWGSISALAIDHGQSLLAVAAQSRLAVFRLTTGPGRAPDIGQTVLEEHLPFVITFLQCNQSSGLLAAGHDLSVRSEEPEPANDWDSLKGGGYWHCDLKGTTLRGSFKPDLAFGNGADPIVCSDDGDTIFAVDRMAGLHS